MRKPKQLELPTWGGRRLGAGRRPKGKAARVSHKARPRFDKPLPVHVTLRVRPHVWNLRSRRSFQRIERCLERARGLFGLRVVEFSVQGNHLHLIVEADGDSPLSRGMQGLCIRIAKALNVLMERSGQVFSDHFHSRLLRSPTELVNAIRYVLGNHAHHFGSAGMDRFSSEGLPPELRERVLAAPLGWLLRSGVSAASG